MKHQNKIKLVSIFAILIILDQLVKYICVKSFPNSIHINEGIFFGYINNIYLTWTLLFLGIVLMIYLIQSKNIKIDIFFMFIAAGAFSNILDRLTYKGVVDYLNLGKVSQFNLADVYIIVGICVYIYKITAKKSYL